MQRRVKKTRMDVNTINQHDMFGPDSGKRKETRSGRSAGEDPRLMTLKEAAGWACSHTGKEVSASNISYLVQYGRIPRHGTNGALRVLPKDLIDYYRSYNGTREIKWKDKLGKDLNWALSFDQYREMDTTKHVHRIHPYKGKFIPQLVGYFLDDHRDKFKRDIYFHPGSIVLDPFCGSGTTLVQSSELGIHAVGIDVSAFNTLISNAKTGKHDLLKLRVLIDEISKSLTNLTARSHVIEFENRVFEELREFNGQYFPSQQYKRQVRQKEIDGDTYGTEKTKVFLPRFNALVREYGIGLAQKTSNTFLDKWYFASVRREIEYVAQLIRKVDDEKMRDVLSIILSRTARSCRATTHSDLATLVSPITGTYYCHKHGKICKPIFSIRKWWNKYSIDTIRRFSDFDKLRTGTVQHCITGDSRNIDIIEQLSSCSPTLAALVKSQGGIDGIFSSPPYVGLIDYHEQHAYAYDLFGLTRRDEQEIGSLFGGQSKSARDSYVRGIADVLINCKRFLSKGYNIFLVANDKYDLYPKIADLSGMEIVHRFRRPVLNRTERDKNAYAETIFHLREK